MEEGKLKISVYVAERKYMLSVLPSEEAGVRNAVEHINQQIKELASKYAFKDRQDILAMIALMNSNKMLEYEKNLNFMNDSFVKRLHHIDELIDHTLNA
jgi:cell division protein ZapA (FtsZ GTPase activity inhibitor)